MTCRRSIRRVCSSPFGRYEQRFGPRRQRLVRVARGLAARAFNTARALQFRPNWSKGALAPGQARAVAADLARQPPEALKVAVCHHPLVEGSPTGR